MSIRLPANTIILLYNFNQTKNTVNLLAFDNTQELQQAKPIHLGRISFTFDKNKLRPYRYEERRGNTYRFLKANDIITLLQATKLVIISSFDRPNNTSEFLEFFDSKNISRPKIMPLCQYCLREYKKLSKLTKNSTYELFGKDVCRTCAVKEIEEEYLRRGIPLTASSKKFFNGQLNRSKSVKKVISALWEPIKAANEGSSSLFDTIPADKNAMPVSFRRFIKTNKLETYFDKDLTNHWLKIGITKLLPVQCVAIKSGLMNKQDLLIVAGTSSGKTFIGELAGLNTLKTGGHKFIFVTPLVALSNQKYEDFKRKYKPLGVRVSLRVGMSKIEVGEDDRIFPDGNFAKSDIIVATYEALDWIFRSGQWKNLGTIGTFVIDEVQLIGDEERGAVVDGLIARLRTLYPKCQIICLSATIGNANNLANELGLQLVNYMHRPIPLERHLLISANDEERVEIIKNLVKNETKILSSTNHSGQSLVFTNTRRGVQELASILKSAGLKSAYYHAGMTYHQRKKVELRFERGEFEVVTTTAALGAGADFPVSQVIFERPGMGARWITIAEYYQMSGRAGRYGFHDLGKSVMIATPGEKIYSAQSKTEEQVAFDIITGEIEEIEGEISYEKEADQVLSYISAAYPISDSEINEYYNRLFYRTNQLPQILKFLSNKGLIVSKNGKWYISPLGRAICESFLEPTFGYNTALKTKKQSVKEIAIEIAPVKSVNLSNKIHARIEQALKYRISRKFLSDSSLEIITSSREVKGKLSAQLIERIKDWNRLFFDCNCKSNPYCHHPESKLSDIILDLRMEGLNPLQIGYEMTKKYDLFMYPGDLLNWLNEIIHALHSVARLAKAMKEKDIVKQSRILASSIENPKQHYLQIKKRGL